MWIRYNTQPRISKYKLTMSVPYFFLIISLKTQNESRKNNFILKTIKMITNAVSMIFFGATQIEATTPSISKK